MEKEMADADDDLLPVPTPRNVPKPAEKGVDLEVEAGRCHAVDDDVAECNPLEYSDLPSPPMRAPVDHWQDLGAPKCRSHSPDSGGSRSASNPEKHADDVLRPKRRTSWKGRLQSRRMLHVDNTEGEVEGEGEATFPRITEHDAHIGGLLALMVPGRDRAVQFRRRCPK